MIGPFIRSWFMPQAMAHTRVDVTSGGKRRSVILGNITESLEPTNQRRSRVSWANGVLAQVRC